MGGRLHALIRVAVVVGTTADGLLAQAETAPPKAFEVISIKPVDRRMARGSYWQPSPNGNLSIHAVPLIALVMGAYNLQDFQIKGLPQWAREEEYDVQATTGLSGEDQSRVEFERDNQSRLKALLMTGAA